MAGMTRDADADFITPGITKGEAKTTLFPWYVYPPVDPSLPECWQELLAERQHFFCLDLTMSITVPVSHLTGWQPHMPLVCKSLISLLARNLKNRYSQEFSGTKMNRRRKLLIPLYSAARCSPPAMTNRRKTPPPDAWGRCRHTLPRFGQCVERMPGRTVPYEVAEIRPQVGGITLNATLSKAIKWTRAIRCIRWSCTFTGRAKLRQRLAGESASTASNARITFNRQASLLKTTTLAVRITTPRAPSWMKQKPCHRRQSGCWTGDDQSAIRECTSPITGVSGKSSVTVGALVTLIRQIRWLPYNVWTRFMSIHAVGARFLTHERRGRQWANQQVQGSTPVQLNLENGKRYSRPARWNSPTRQWMKPRAPWRTGDFPQPKWWLAAWHVRHGIVDEGSRQNVLLVPQEGVTHTPRVKQRRSFWIKTMSCSYANWSQQSHRRPVGRHLWLAGCDRVIVSGLQRIRPGIKARAIPPARKTPAPNRNNNVAGLRDFHG